MINKLPWVSAATVIEDVDVNASNLDHPDEDTREMLSEIPPGMNYQYFTTKMNHPRPKFEWRSKFSDYLRKAHPNNPVKTILAEPGYRTGPYHWDGRRFHREELSRLHSFPSWFEFPDATTVSRTLVGNSVPPALGESVVSALSGDCETVESDELPSPRRGRTSHQTYRRRCERRLKEIYGEGVLDND